MLAIGISRQYMSIPIDVRWAFREQHLQQELCIALGPDVWEGVAQFFQRAIAKEQLQKDQRWTPRASFVAKDRRLPGFGGGKPTVLEGQAQPTAIHIHLDLAR